MADSNKIKHVVIVGAGVAGLASAYLIREIGRENGFETNVTVLEAKDKAGGSTRTDIVDGYICEWGPNGFLDNEPATLDLVKKLGLENRLVKADESSSRRFIYHSGKIREMPLNPLKFLKSDILPLSSKLRMALEFFISKKQGNSDETVYSFGKRRLGEGFTSYLLDPMISGIFAGNIKELSLKAIFPKMVSMEQEYGSLFKALIAKKREAKKRGEEAGGPAGPKATLHTFVNGMGELTDTLTSKVKAEIRFSSPVKSIEKQGNSFIVYSNNESFQVDAVVLACPSYESAKIIGKLDDKVSRAIAEIPFAPIDVVCQGYPEFDIEHSVDGFGVLIPRSEGIRSLGCLWSDSIFPGQAPDGYHLLRTIIGGAHDPNVVDLSDESLAGVAHKDLDRILGARKKPGFQRVYRHPKGIAQYTVGHLDRVATSEQLEKSLPGLYLTGVSYRGVSVNGCIKDAYKVARKLWDVERVE